MSGRFPGSDSIEELWTSIMERKEFHKKVKTTWTRNNFLFGCWTCTESSRFPRIDSTPTVISTQKAVQKMLLPPHTVAF
jgi:hypothetical protein